MLTIGKSSETYSLALPETNNFAPENGWLEYDHFLLGDPIFRGELLVFREGGLLPLGVIYL